MGIRYKSLDVFRGITIALMILVNTPGSWAHIYSPLGHSDWHGYTPTDLVFPFFLVAVGLSMTFSFQKYDPHNHQAFYLKVIRRTLLIFLIGLALTAFPFINKDYSQLRILGVLQRIALAYFLASILIHHFNNVKKLIFISVAILIGYWLLLILFGGSDPFSLEHSLERKIDLLILGEAHMWHGKEIAFDPEGILSTLPAVVSVISGYLLGLIIRKYKQMDLVARILLIGNVLVIGGYSWSLIFPINKSLWTSSYVLVTSGIAAVVIGILIYILDIKQYRKWALPFEAFGMNPLIIYVLSIIWVKIYFIIPMGEQNMYGWLYTTVFKPIINPTFGSFLFALFHVFGCWLVAYILYKKKIYIKL
jgi:predicted acyltransferase